MAVHLPASGPCGTKPECGQLLYETSGLSSSEDGANLPSIVSELIADATANLMRRFSVSPMQLLAIRDRSITDR